MHRTFTYRIYPNEAQQTRINNILETLSSFFEAARLESSYWQGRGVQLSIFEQEKSIKDIRTLCEDYRSIQFDWWRDVLLRTRKAKKYISKQRSFTCWHKTGWKLEGNRLYVSGLGYLKLRLHRALRGEIKLVRFLKICKKYFVQFVCSNIEKEPLPMTNRRVGLDLGIKRFITLSDGNCVENPRISERYSKQIKKIYRQLANRQEGSRRRQQLEEALENIYRKIEQTRRTFHHTVARQLLERYDFIAVEDLAVSRLIRTGKFGRDIKDLGFGQFLRILEEKAAYYGKQVVRVPPKNTSQECSRCGALAPKSLRVRVHRCSYCGLVLDRDLNAAKNILCLGEAIAKARSQATDLHKKHL